jgi:hypothetical protein
MSDTPPTFGSFVSIISSQVLFFLFFPWNFRAFLGLEDCTDGETEVSLLLKFNGVKIDGGGR